MRHDSVTFLQSGIISIIINFLQLTELCNSSKTVKGRDNTEGCARQDTQDFFSHFKFFHNFSGVVLILYSRK